MNSPADGGKLVRWIVFFKIKIWKFKNGENQLNKSLHRNKYAVSKEKLTRKLVSIKHIKLKVKRLPTELMISQALAKKENITD